MIFLLLSLIDYNWMIELNFNIGVNCAYLPSKVKCLSWFWDFGIDSAKCNMISFITFQPFEFQLLHSYILFFRVVNNIFVSSVCYRGLSVRCSILSVFWSGFSGHWSGLSGEQLYWTQLELELGKNQNVMFMFLDTIIMVSETIFQKTCLNLLY